MAEPETKINLTIREIYEQLCPKCKAKLKSMLKEKITDKMVEKAIK